MENNLEEHEVVRLVEEKVEVFVLGDYQNRPDEKRTAERMVDHARVEFVGHVVVIILLEDLRHFHFAFGLNSIVHVTQNSH